MQITDSRLQVYRSKIINWYWISSSNTKYNFSFPVINDRKRGEIKTVTLKYRNLIGRVGSGQTHLFCFVWKPGMHSRKSFRPIRWTFRFALKCDKSGWTLSKNRKALSTRVLNVEEWIGIQFILWPVLLDHSCFMRASTTTKDEDYFSKWFQLLNVQTNTLLSVFCIKRWGEKQN